MGESLSPQELWRQLRSIDAGLLDNLAFLCRLRRAESGTGAAYCTPGRAWLAQRLGVSVWTISRHTSRLKRLGALEKVQRRPKAGKWQTNLYVLRGRCAWIVGTALARVRRPPSRVPSGAHIAPSEGETAADPGGAAALRAIIRTLQARIRGG